MISKLAIQSGLGVTVVGGGIGIAFWKLKKTPTVPNSTTDDDNEMDAQPSDNSSDDPKVSDLTNEYLVQVVKDLGNDQPTEEFIEKTAEKDKNYLCQWKENKNTMSDKDCIIKQIQFDTNKKAVFLSKIMEKFNNKSDADSAATSILTKDNLKNHKNWFFLKIKGYKFDLESTKPKSPNIDIVFSKEGSKNNKKYATLKPVIKISNQKAIQGKTRTFLVKHTKDKSDGAIKDFQCKWNNEIAKECYIYKFETQPTSTGQQITEISLANTVKLTDAVAENHYYIISFKEQEQDIISLIDNPATIIVVEQKENSNKKVGEFTVINSMIGKVKDKDSKLENFILLN